MPIVFGPSGSGDPEDKEDEVEITYLGPRYSKGLIRMKEEPHVGRPSKPVRPPGGVAANLFGSNDAKHVRRGNFPAPPRQYTSTDSGPGDGGDPGDGDDGYGGGGGGPPNPPNPPNKPDGGKGKKMLKDNKPKGGSGRPDGGDGGDDPDPNEDDDDEKFRRRMIKFLGGFVDPKMDDKPEVKEADAIKILALPWPKPIATGESRLVRQLLQHPLIRIMLSNG